MYNEFDKEEFAVDEEEMGDPKKSGIWADDEELDDEPEDGDLEDDGDDEDGEKKDPNPLVPGEEEEI